MSDSARKIQEHLIRLGYLKGEPDGDVGPLTLSAFEKLLTQLPKSATKRQIKLVRFKQTRSSTTSKVTIEDSNFQGFILEPAGPSTVTPNLDRRIPTGIYKLSAYSSAKFPNVYLLRNDQVSASRLILIHSGNSPKDTLGCLLIGLAHAQDRVSNSVLALNQLREIIKDGGGPDNFELVISEDFQ